MTEYNIHTCSPIALSLHAVNTQCTLDRRVAVITQCTLDRRCAVNTQCTLEGCCHYTVYIRGLLSLQETYPEAEVAVDVVWSAQLGGAQHELLQTLGCVVFVALNSDLSALTVHNTPLRDKTWKMYIHVYSCQGECCPAVLQHPAQCAALTTASTDALRASAGLIKHRHSWTRATQHFTTHSWEYMYI